MREYQEGYYPDELVFMYSPQWFHWESQDTNTHTFKVRVVNSDNGRNFIEVRKSKASQTTSGVQVFDIDLSGIMRMLAPDPDELLQKIDYGGVESTPTLTNFSVELYQDGSSSLFFSFTMWAKYGALDAGESYDTNAPRRIWTNWPCTVFAPPEVTNNGEIEADYETAYIGGGGDIYPGLPGEFNIVAFVFQDPDNWGVEKEAMLDGRDPDFGGGQITIKDGVLTVINGAPMPMTVDLTPRRDDRYMLRWLDRRGDVRYWLFNGGNFQLAASAANSFTRPDDGFADVPRGASLEYYNGLKTSFAAGRTLTLGTKVGADDYELLCSLAVSPAVSLLVGGTTTAPKWMRVNVAAGTYTRNRRRTTPRLEDFEVTISLPTIHTVTL